ncbi:STAS domain-containing protein [Nonomuraea sp. NPDC059194]|uniref:STAS domain-containing protein n=1 Tax=Nonomuraea sp. NPDC059194 TaxID=3346764 RepID=UPI0036AA3019
MPSLMLTCRHRPGVALISVTGEIDTTTSGQLDAYIQQARRQPGDHLVFDLAEMPFMDSTGLRVLLNTYTFTSRHGGTVRLVALQPAPSRILQITGVDSHLPVHATVADALAALQIE